MTPSTALLTHVLGFLTLASDIALVVFALVFIVAITRKDSARSIYARALIQKVGRFALPLALIVGIVGIVTTLYYSEVAGFEPCKLCWFQRIFLYPQAFIVIVALFRKTRDIGYYLITLSALGVIVALYHYNLQWGGAPLIPCSADLTLACSKRYFVEFGYITESMMALTAFLSLIALSLTRIMFEKNNNQSAA